MAELERKLAERQAEVMPSPLDWPSLAAGNATRRHSFPGSGVPVA